MSTGGTRYSSRSSGSRYSYGQSRSIGQVVGDVIFMHDNGLRFCVFYGVNDPQNLVKLVKSLHKSRLDSLDR
jgi:hypothetical protein